MSQRKQTPALKIEMRATRAYRRIDGRVEYRVMIVSPLKDNIFEVRPYSGWMPDDGCDGYISEHMRSFKWYPRRARLFLYPPTIQSPLVIHPEKLDDLLTIEALGDGQYEMIPMGNISE